MLVTATDYLTVIRSINPIFQYSFDCFGINRVWMVCLTLILKGSPQKKKSNGVKSQFRDGQSISEFRLIITFATVRKRSIKLNFYEYHFTFRNQKKKKPVVHISNGRWTNITTYNKAIYLN